MGEHLTQQTAGERRQSPRRKVSLELRLLTGKSLLNMNNPDESEPPSLIFFGATHDISASGLAFALPLVRVDERFCAKEGGTLQIWLHLPAATVEMRAALVRCHPLDEKEPERGYFGGAKITDVQESERALLIEYLNSIR